ncbi:TadE/TadG family type IV pilus assembly protein [Demequina capsici]|uniref:TadE/TadG family type IV pilus assembly protein n=1 Tax=Demequina capsici TaxID=3075620 RepID=A0AA96JB66_9MICO|nr:TadE/TadG family type IV pilus assembly protein [Demequina sp. PMTSA13]WNM28095.1 TadE/TadG family type IV pilus assembly protein [Demequina sp. PMTSA13]
MITEQLMGMVLVVLLALGVMQVALAVHVRNTMIECAVEGARLAGRDGADLADGEARAKNLAAQAIPGIVTTAHAHRTTVGGLQAVAVELSASMPVIGLWGPGDLKARGTALQEGPGA